MRQKLVICAQWLDYCVPKPHSCLVHSSSRCAQTWNAPWHTNANQFLHFVSAVLPFLIQSPLVRLLLANWRIFSEYLKCKVSLYMGMLASCSPVYEVYVVEQILPFNKDLPCNTRSSKQYVLNIF